MQKKRDLILLLDVDGIVVDDRQTYLELANKLFNRPIVFNRVCWDFLDAMGLNPEERVQLEKAIETDLEFPLKLKPYPDAIEAVHEIRRMFPKLIIQFVTSDWKAHPQWVYQRRIWLKNHFEKYTQLSDHAVFTNQKHQVYGDIFVDDKPSNVLNWASAMDLIGFTHRIPVLWTKPYNGRHPESHAHTHTTNEWSFIIKQIITLYESLPNIRK